MAKKDDIIEEGKVVETPIPKEKVKEEQTVKISDVEKLINQAIKNFKESEKPMSPKRVTEHTAHVWRFDGKWVVDFKDRNTDPYVKEKIHAFNKFNEQRREFESWIELVFHDGSTKEIPLTRYLQSRTPVYCPILKRNTIDKSYSIGEVEKTKEKDGIYIGTGVMIDQMVNMTEESFEVKTPDNELLTLPGYVIA